jgi:DNA invertase Pin-like site-specific DNA recombinase
MAPRALRKAVKKRAVIYLRGFPAEQSIQVQRAELEAAAERADWRVVEVYEDDGSSDAKNGDQGPAFDRLFRDAAHRRFDIVMAWSIDRLGASLKHLIDTLACLHSARIHLYLMQQRVDTTTRSGRALFKMVDLFAEFERGILQEQVVVGVQRAGSTGRHFGPPRADRRLAFAIRALLAAGFSMKETAALHELGVSTVRRLKASAAE